MLDKKVSASAFLGLSFFLISNTLTLWGGFPLTELVHMDILDVLAYWAIPLITSMSLGFFTASICAKHLHMEKALLGAAISGFFYLLGYIALITLSLLNKHSTLVVVLAAVAFGLGNVGFLLAWEYVFSKCTEESAIKIILGATVFFPLTFMFMSLVAERAMAVGIVVLIPTTALLMFTLASMRHDEQQQPKEAEQDDCAPAREMASCTQNPSARALRMSWAPLFCVASFGFIVAITRTIALNTVANIDTVGRGSLIGVIAAAVLLGIIWLVLKRRFTLPAFYNAMFPFIATALLLLPVAGPQWAAQISAFIYFAYYVVLSLMMLTAIQIAQKTKTNALFVYGLLGGTTYLFLAIGTLVSIEQFKHNSYGDFGVGMIALFAIYILSLALGLIHNRRFETSEALEESPTNLKPASNNTAPTHQHYLDDSVRRIATALSDRFDLSSRERDVVFLMIRGRDAPRIAKQLHISANTVRYHTKNIYQKLGIHSRQDLLSLVEESAIPDDVEIKKKHE